MERNKPMSVAACPRCGSRHIRQGTIADGVLTGYTSRNVCRKCGYQGMPILFDSYNDYQKFVRELPKNKRFVDSANMERGTGQEDSQVHARPFGITVLAVLMFFLCISAALLSYYLIESSQVDTILGVYYLSLSVLAAVALPYGYLKGKRWAWTVGAVIYVLYLPVGLLFLYYLTRPHVKSYFEQK